MVREEEKSRIAESIHDGIGQLLFSLKLKLGQLTLVFYNHPRTKK
jgi:signal transduction histidine kinase